MTSMLRFPARRRLGLLTLLVLLLTIATCSALALSWSPWSRAALSSSSYSSPPSSQPDRVRSYESASAPHITAIDANVLWGELEARARLSTCWKQMLADLKTKCRSIRSNNDLRSRLALGLAGCDAEADGRLSLVFQCASHHKVQRCIQSLSEVAYNQFVQYRLHTDNLCTYLEAELYQERTEIAVEALRGEAAITVQSLQGLQAVSQDVHAQLNTAARQQEQQALAALAVQAQLRAVEEGQAAALRTLHASAETLVSSSAQTEAALTDLRHGISRAAQDADRSIEALAEQARTHYQALEEQTTGLLGMFTRFESMQRAFASQVFTAHDAARGLVGVVLVLVSTSFSRTMAARWPALMLIAVSVALPPLTGWHSRVTLLPHTAPVAMSGIGVLAALCLIGVVYTHTTSLAVQHRHLVRDEVERGVEQVIQRVGQLLQPLSTPATPRTPDLPMSLPWMRSAWQGIPRSDSLETVAAVPLDNDTEKESLPCESCTTSAGTTTRRGQAASPTKGQSSSTTKQPRRRTPSTKTSRAKKV